MHPIRVTKTTHSQPSPTTTTTKKTLYSRISETYFLPSLQSTGLNRKYLEKVQEGTVFRVETMELNRFLAELKPKQLRKAPFTCKSQAYSKMNRLLQEMGKPGLSFEEGQLPDGEWLYRVARFIDPWNVCGIFTVALKTIPNIEVDSFKVELGKRAIEHDLLISSGLDEVQEVRTAINQLLSSHKRFVNRKAELDNLSIYGRQLTRQVEEDKREMERQLTNATLVVYCAGENVSGGEALAKTDSKKQEIYERTG